MNSMVGSKSIELKEEYIKGKTKSYLPRRKISEVERTFQEFSQKPS